MKMGDSFTLVGSLGGRDLSNCCGSPEGNPTALLTSKPKVHNLIMSMMVTKLCPKLILEGTRLTGKTDLALALNENPRIVGARKYRYHSPIISAEWNGFVKNPYGSSLIDFDEKYEGQAMEAYRIWLSLFELYR